MVVDPFALEALLRLVGDMRVATTLLTVPRGATCYVDLSWSVKQAWDPAACCFAVDYLDQPSIRRTTLTATIRPPADFVNADDVGSGTVVHAGAVKGRLNKEACFTTYGDDNGTR